ncbi:MAG TPA: cytochrome c oxidase assembly protein, partial [Acidimicrobiales bacterium]|nr:cytochrome c oxidase assembly protein [Acidimicrobiales bacterium]
MLLADAISPHVSLHTLLTRFQTDWLNLLALAIEVGLAVWYLVSVRRLEARGRGWSGRRTACFVGGTVLVIVAVQSGLASYDDQVFWIHVIQHLLLMNFAPILFALSAPMTLALQASSRRTQGILLRVLHHPVVEFITNPVVVVVGAYGTMLVYFLTPFYNFSLEHPWVHDLTHLHFLISGALFWWIVIGRDPSRWRPSFPAKLGVLAAGIPVNAILGVSLTGATASIAPHFHSLGDTHVGGSILWVVGELTTLIAMGIVLYQWMQFEERVAVRADRRAA